MRKRKGKPVVVNYAVVDAVIEGYVAALVSVYGVERVRKALSVVVEMMGGVSEL